MSNSKKASGLSASQGSRRQFTREFKGQAVEMLLDGHSAASIVERLGLSGTNLLYRCRQTLHCHGHASPRREVGGDREPTTAELRRLPEQAHEECFIATSVRTEIRVEI